MQYRTRSIIDQERHWMLVCNGEICKDITSIQNSEQILRIHVLLNSAAEITAFFTVMCCILVNFKHWGMNYIQIVNFRQTM
jgi:hypothetical protein